MVFPSPKKIRNAAALTAHRLAHGAVADLTPTPADPLGTGLIRYRPAGSVIATGPPVLLVPPPVPGASTAFDLRRDGSLAAHLVGTGRRVYLLDFCAGDREQSLTAWVGETLPDAVRRVSLDAGERPVQLVGWSLGGALALLAAAADPGLPVASVATLATPADPAAAPPGSALGPLDTLTGGADPVLLGAFGRISPPLARRGYEMLGIDTCLRRPITLLAHLADPDFLADREAVDAFTHDLGEPGRAAARAYERFYRRGDLASGEPRVGGKPVPLSRIRIPVLVVAGRDDALAPLRAVYPLTRLLTGTREVRFTTAAGGHLGALTARTARRTTWTRLGAWLDEATLQHGMRPTRKDRDTALHRR
ncbi:alpha/beta hydrolase [Actinocorallia sp. API 0066]|uniref:alpha/beta hydrolase n=1 Tax=Actinocorallia sp. API 0066 TaxID=2896846 RepID=UPI001E2D2A64|nr:alpha/beta hydrolase [Actinocorallia sp. API 0066]MCD0451926.1 alpha/beta hydrolase [Actinocorallia sp. API 0066]